MSTVPYAPGPRGEGVLGVPWVNLPHHPGSGPRTLDFVTRAMAADVNLKLRSIYVREHKELTKYTFCVKHNQLLIVTAPS